MSTGNRITEFFRNRVGNLGISSLVLVVLEKILDNDFVCPCLPGYNEWICICYAVIPTVACFFFTLCFVDPIPEDRVMRDRSTFNKFLYSTLIAFIWLFLFFADGRYVACACSHWDGEYTVTGSLQWCKPTGNKTVLQHQQESQRYITISQFTGFGIVVVISVVLGISFCCNRRDQQNGHVQLSDLNNDQRGGSYTSNLTQISSHIHYNL